MPLIPKRTKKRTKTAREAGVGAAKERFKKAKKATTRKKK